MNEPAPVIWVHGDALDPESPPFVACPGAPAIFVFDDVVLDGYRVSLARILFIYESLLEMPVAIRRGDVAGEVVRFARDHGAGRVVTTATPSPRFALLREAIEAELPVEVLPVPPFVPDRAYDLKRFSRYWAQAGADAMIASDAPRPVTLPGFG